MGHPAVGRVNQFRGKTCDSAGDGSVVPSAGEFARTPAGWRGTGNPCECVGNCTAASRLAERPGNEYIDGPTYSGDCTRARFCDEESRLRRDPDEAGL